MRSKLVKFAEIYAEEYLICPDPEIKNDREALNDWKKNRVTEITNQTAPQTFFLHERGSDVCNLVIERTYSTLITQCRET